MVQNWVEINPKSSNESIITPEIEHTAVPSGTLSIETGRLRITADGYYPVPALSVLLKELVWIC